MWGWVALPPDPAVVGERWQEQWRERIRNMSFWFEQWGGHQTRDRYWSRTSVREHYDKSGCRGRRQAARMGIEARRVQRKSRDVARLFRCFLTRIAQARRALRDRHFTTRSINRASRGSPEGRGPSIGTLRTPSGSWEPTAYFKALRQVRNTPNRSPFSVGLLPWPKPALHRVRQQVGRRPQGAGT
jgi:hypothetical protein